ncbi:40352_t:CDS:2 [Gigaspora margarita]|uniref:40352_t:CDS:1 n=1 Tax=Gigaspora margarita TaxID=4874 RepID=A0ABN7V2Z5_GIGMA|nr:40352_t:CDS:2 [Gigaspora margarita]
MSSKAQQKIDLNDLDLNCSYTFEEFEYINDQLKYHTFEINGQPVNLFEHDKNGNLIPMPQSTINMEAVVSEIVRQLGNWNIQTGQGGAVTSSQGGFNFHVGGRRTIHETFTPMVVIEVSDTIKKKVFDDLDEKFKIEYFAMGTSVQMGLLIDPQKKRMWIYKRNEKGEVFRCERTWGDIDGGDILPGFTLDVEMIEDIISQESRSTETSKKSESVNCPKCNNHFTDHHSFMKHFEKSHIREQKG